MAYAKAKYGGLSPAVTQKTVALYVRVSTKYQEDKDSIPHQIKELKAYCKHVLHLDNFEVFEDAGKSGKNTDRPAFQRMIKKIRSGLISYVVVYKIDRISRNLVDFSVMYDEFKKNRVTFVSLNEQFDTSSAIGEAMLKIILVFAELERKMTSERVTDIMFDRAKNGLWNGANVPFGYCWDEESKYPIPDPNEAKIVRLIYDMYEEISSTGKICKYLNDNNIPTKRRGEWSGKTVADIIRNPFYKGTYRYNYRESPHGKIKPKEEWIIKDDNHEAIITLEQYNRCNDVMDYNAYMRHHNGFEPKKKFNHVFGGRLRCGLCGSNFHSDKDKARDNGFFPSLYRCGARTRKFSCEAVTTSDVVLGPFIFNYISNMVKASNSRRNLNSPNELEEILLNGPEFEKVAGIDNEGLQELYMSLLGRSASPAAGFVPIPLTAATVEIDASEIDVLKADVTKYTRAIERLKKAFLFDEEGMDEKEYLSTKRDLETKIVNTNNKMADLETSLFETSAGEMAFITSASSFLLAHKIQSGEHIVYSEFAPAIDDKTLKDFICLIIDTITILDGKVADITFKNGLCHKFIWKE
jgi:DNA invertase Pin-like site-specific DNA recombinase